MSVALLARFSNARIGTALLTLLCAASYTVVTEAKDFVDLRRIQTITNGDAAAGKAKAELCVACHGNDGLSPAPLFPHLRGMTIEYLYTQLRDFKEGQGPQEIMQPIVGPMSDQDLRDTAAYYARVGTQPLTSKPAATSRADAQVTRQGERLYLTGDATRGIPPCQGCHGEQARGHPDVNTPGAPAAYRMYPPLRGQQFDYLVTKLKEYRDGKLTRSSNDFIMTGVAHTLDDDSIQAIAAWLHAQPIH